jgi:predicted dehydrogenase
LRDRFQVRALADQVPQHARQEAQRLGCSAVAGPTEMMERADLDALLLLDPQWYGLWALGLACHWGKPVFCCPSLASDDQHADAICRQVRDARLPVMVELAPRAAPATARLRQLLAEELGPPRSVVCSITSGRAAPVLSAGILALVDWCATIAESKPVSVQSGGGAALGLTWLGLEFAGGQAATIHCQRLPALRRDRWALRVAAERGTAMIVLPSRVRWESHDGQRVHILPVRRLGALLLEQFHRMAVQGEPPSPSLDDAYRALGWLRAATVSGAEGRRLALTDG